MAVDRFEFDKGLQDLLDADATIATLLGDPPRIYDRPVRDATFPWVRKDNIPSPPLFGTMKGPGVNWVRQITCQFSIFALANSLEEVCDVMAALAAVLDDVPQNITVTGGNVAMSKPLNEWADYDEHGTAMGVLEYTFSLEDTT